MNHTLQIGASGGGTAYTGSNWFALNGVTSIAPAADRKTPSPARPDAVDGSVIWYSLNGRLLGRSIAPSRNVVPLIVVRQTLVNGARANVKTLLH